MSAKFTEKDELEKAIDDYLGSNSAGLPPMRTWDVSEVEDMSDLFNNRILTPEDNEKLEGIGLTGGWDVSNVSFMENMFAYCTSFDQPLEGWNVGEVENMSNMFFDCTSFNQPLDGWDVGSVAVWKICHICFAVALNLINH